MSRTSAEWQVASGARDVPWRAALGVFLLAFALRVAAIFVLDAGAQTARGPWQFGYEASSIAVSLHEGHGFANPWRQDTPPWNVESGPTGWLAPGYPLLVAAMLDLFGGLVPGAAVALFLAQSFLSALTCVILWLLGVELGAPRAGRFAAFAFAVLPGAVWTAASFVWDTSIVALGIAAFVWACARFARSSPWTWVAVGAGLGALVLVNPAPLALVPTVALLAYARRDTTVRWLARLGVMAAVAFVACVPWLARNQRVLGSFAMRTNLGVELRAGNYEGAYGRFEVGRHPSYSRVEFERYREMGEVRYCAWAGNEARAWIRDHPRDFLELCVYRAYLFWIGEDPWHDSRTTTSGADAAHDAKSWIKFLAFALTGLAGLVGAVAWARREPSGRAVLLGLVLFPVTYYVTHVSERYRFPIEPLLVLAAAWFVASRTGGVEERA